MNYLLFQTFCWSFCPDFTLPLSSMRGAQLDDRLAELGLPARAGKVVT